MSAIEVGAHQVSKRQIKKRKARLEQQQAIAAEYDQYRALSFGAVLTLGIAVSSIPVVFVASTNPFLLMLPLLGLIIGAYTMLQLRGRQAEYTGFGYARAGLAISAFSFGVGTFLAIYTYATEVPDGYERVSFSQLQPDPRRRDIPYSPKAEELSGQQVFVKGYVYPDGQLNDIKRFVLVPDMGTCCFGGQPKLTDMVQVTLQDPLRTKYSYTRRSFAGRFRVAASATDKVGTVIYHLDADYAK